MIIVSQDKKEIVNFDNIMNIEMTNCYEDGYGIFAGFIVGRDDNYRLLGYYKTEEKAKEVIEGLFSYRAVFEYYKSSPNSVKNEIAKDFIKDEVMFDIFEMPEN